MIKLLIVDDSPFIRKALIKMVQSEPDIEVVGEAANGKDGVQMVLDLDPDVVTMDVEMPLMDGISALKEIMTKHPVPVIMFSSLTEEGAKVTLEALEAGAVDYLSKDIQGSSLSIFDKKHLIIEKIKNASKAKIKNLISHKINLITLPTSKKEDKIEKKEKKYEVLTIGTSTGGPPALERVIPNLSKGISMPVLVVQHMPPIFTKSLAERLNSLSPLQVKEAEHNEVIDDNIVYIAPGGHHMKLKKHGSRYIINIFDMDSLYTPSVDFLFNSVGGFFKDKTLGVVMTGMGHDGLEGSRTIKHFHGTVIAQDEESCVVYGMPRVVIENKLADFVLPLEQIAFKIMKLVMN